MAGIIFSVASGLNESVFGKIQDPLKAFIDRANEAWMSNCLLYTSPSPRDKRQSRMPSSA